MNRRARFVAVLFLLFCPLAVSSAAGQSSRALDSQQSLADRSMRWPEWDQWSRLFLLQDYNTRVVILGTTLLGCAAGMIGSFALLRRRALMGDAISHATLPGIAIAFIIATKLGVDGKSLFILLIGAAATGLLGVGAILVIRTLTRLKEDTALGAVLSVFFGAGIALLGVIQQMKGGHAAGLESFIYGKTATMGMQDTQLIGAAALICITICLLLFKEFILLCFDEGFAVSRGVPVVRLDLALMSLVVTVSIVGLQAVGLILMIALLVIPAAAARFWTEKMWKMFFIAGGLGAVGGMVGAGVSALFSKLPSGAMIVLVCTSIFLFSLVFGSANGVLVRWQKRRRLNRSIDRQHLLRAIYEILETLKRLSRDPSSPFAAVAIGDLLPKRSWSRKRLIRSVKRCRRDQLVEWVDESIWLTGMGMAEAVRLTRQHRLWELYLITHADIAPGRVDRDADAIEHVLESEVIVQLETLLKQTYPEIPASPHELATPLAEVVSEHSGSPLT